MNMNVKKQDQDQGLDDGERFKRNLSVVLSLVVLAAVYGGVAYKLFFSPSIREFTGEVWSVRYNPIRDVTVVTVVGHGKHCLKGDHTDILEGETYYFKLEMLEHFDRAVIDLQRRGG